MFERHSKHPRTNVYLTKSPVLPGPALDDEMLLVEALIEKEKEKEKEKASKPHSAFAPPANTVASLSAGAKTAKAGPVKLKARKK